MNGTRFMCLKKNGKAYFPDGLVDLHFFRFIYYSLNIFGGLVYWFDAMELGSKGLHFGSLFWSINNDCSFQVISPSIFFSTQ